MVGSSNRTDITSMSLSEIEDEARSKHIAKLDFFKTVRASVEEVGLSSLLIIPSFSTCTSFFCDNNFFIWCGKIMTVYDHDNHQVITNLMKEDEDDQLKRVVVRGLVLIIRLV